MISAFGASVLFPAHKTVPLMYGWSIALQVWKEPRQKQMAVLFRGPFVILSCACP